MERKQLEDILDSMEKSKILVLGDMGLDIYWNADMRLSRLARENPYHYVPITDEKITLGGGGNLTRCIATLSKQVSVISIIGNDWKGREILRLLDEEGVNTDGIIVSDEWNTVSYGKIRRRGVSDDVVYEDPHLYFENYRDIPGKLEQEILKRLKDITANFDYIFITDYQLHGVMNKNIRKAVSAYGQQGVDIVVDSRDYLTDYSYVTLKPNDVELFTALQDKSENLNESIRQLYHKQNLKNICVTLGKKGAVCFDGSTLTEMPTKEIKGETDTVGAGDAFGAAFTAALAGGSSLTAATNIGNLAAYVVVQKIGTTGTASRKEILAVNEL